MAGILGLNSASIFVADLPRHVDFYATKLGFTVVPEESSERAAMLQAGDFRLLLHAGGPTAAPSDLAMHLHLEVDDIDGYWEQLRSRGLDMAEQPEDRPWGLRTFHLRDPSGYEWEFTQPVRT